MAVTTPNISELFVFNEIPGGLVNCSNTVFTTSNPFAEGSLSVYLDGVKICLEKITVNPSLDGFTLDFAPLDSEQLTVNYLSC